MVMFLSLIALDVEMSKLLVQLNPALSKYVGADGRIVVRLKRALYGCVQSSKLWYEKLCKVLSDYGFVANPYDNCVFNKGSGKEQITVCFHVDDLLITCADDSKIKLLEEYLRSKFTDVSFTHGDKHSYLSMIICKEGNKHWTVSMTGYIDKCLQHRPDITGVCASPARE